MSSFQAFCCICNNAISIQEGGMVFSCGEYICIQCSNLYQGNFLECPSCRKKGVKVLCLNSTLPNEISKKMSDCANSLNDIQEQLVFQIKYYKNFIKKLVSASNEQRVFYERYVT